MAHWGGRHGEGTEGRKQHVEVWHKRADKSHSVTVLLCVCARVCMCACVHVCMCACVHVQLVGVARCR